MNKKVLKVKKTLEARVKEYELTIKRSKDSSGFTKPGSLKYSG
jgi:hypothetical protein